ncbi:hypothetical protein VaNZ11_012614 [Volvox africanus]|uniref:RNA helicase n=1 Tax=Volvox africanus TaxID=51714 RepID=A0ABQ5SF12_9CHLO|nr:hypothetical protein VaNZ11_012614 [Volvox africanus]
MPHRNTVAFPPVSALPSVQQQHQPNATVGENQPSTGSQSSCQMPLTVWAGCPPEQPMLPAVPHDALPRVSQGLQGPSWVQQNGSLSSGSAQAGTPGLGGNSAEYVGVPNPVPGAPQGLPQPPYSQPYTILQPHPFYYAALHPYACQSQPSSAAQAGASHEAALGPYLCSPPGRHGVVAQQTLRYPMLGQKPPLPQEPYRPQLNLQLLQPKPLVRSKWISDLLLSATCPSASHVEDLPSRWAQDLQAAPRFVPFLEPMLRDGRADGQVKVERRQSTVVDTVLGGGSRTPMLHAVPCAAPPAVCEWVLAGGLDKLQISVLQVPGGAVRDQWGVVVVSEDVNFGVRAIVEDQALEKPHAGQPTATLPQIVNDNCGKQTNLSAVHPPGAPPGATATAWDAPCNAVAKTGDEEVTAAAGPIVKGSLRIANRRADAILLVNVRAMPRYSHCLRLTDDAGIAVQDPAKAMQRRNSMAPATMSGPSNMEFAHAIPAVLLPPGSEYVVDVVLNLSQANFTSQRAERGLLAQLVLFTFVVDHRIDNSDEPLLSPSIISLPGGCVVRAATHSDGGKDTPDAADAETAPDVEMKSQMWKSYAAIVGGRVAVAVVDKRRLMEVNSMLKATAPPFIPKGLRELFISQPSRVHSCTATIAESLFPFESVSSVLTCATVAAAPVTLAIRALITALSELHPFSQPWGPNAATKGPFGPVSPLLLSAVNGTLRAMMPAPASTIAAASASAADVTRRTYAAVIATGTSSTTQAAASDGPTLAAAVTMEWAPREGVGRPAVQRLRALYEHLVNTDPNRSWEAGQRRMDITQTEWGRQLVAGLKSKSSIQQEAVQALQAVFDRAAAAATIHANDIVGIGRNKIYTTYSAAVGTAPAMTAALAYQRFELLRYANLLVEEEDVMEHDIRTFTLYNARARVAVFSDNMATYQVLNWPPFAAQQQYQQQPQQNDAASIPSMQQKTEGTPAAPRPYRGPKLLTQCVFSLDAQEQNEHSVTGQKVVGVKPSRGAAKVKKKGAAARPGARKVLLAAVVDVPGLVEDRPRLVTGDLVFLRLEAQRTVEYVSQLLAVDGGQVLLVMPHDYWHDIGALFHRQEQKLTAAVPAPLAHCCFSFDRTPFGRMHEALLRAALRPQLLLPPPPPPPATEATTDAPGLPDLPEDLYPQQPHRQMGPEVAASSGRTDEELAAVAATLRLVGGTALNPEQRLACAAMLCGAGRDLPFVLFGPPGTGKTVTLVECALQILGAEGPSLSPFPGSGGRRQRSSRLLLAAPQNYSADLITSSLAAALGSQAGGGRLLRLNDPRRRVVEAKADVLPYSLIDEATATFRLPKPNEIQMAQIVVCSCSAAGMLREGAFVREALSSAAQKAHTGSGSVINSCGEGFTHVLVDEAGQALLPEVLIPLTLRTPGGAAILCGDPRQLEPIVRSASAARNGLATSLLELLMESARREGHLARARGAADLTEILLAGAPPSSPPPPSPAPSTPSVPSARSALQHGSPKTGPERRRHGREVTVSEPLAPQHQSPLRGVMLVRNYRSAAPLLDLPSRLFYDQQLKACVDAESARPPNWDLLLVPAKSTATAAAPAGLVASRTALPLSVSDSTAALASGPNDAAAFNDTTATATATATTGGSLEAEARGQGLQVEKVSSVTVSGDASMEDDALKKSANRAPWKKGQQQPAAAGAAGAAAALVPEAVEAPEPPGAANWDGDGDGEIVAPSHLLFFGVRGQQHQELDAPSYFNPLEATTVTDLVDSLIKASWAAATQRLEAQRQRSGGGASTPGQLLSGVVSQNHIGIICTYRKQVFKMRQLLRERGLGGVRVGTVDDYQGQEERIIFISTVLSRVESLPAGGGGATGAGTAPAASQSLGLWSHPRRFNVAVTRSRALLVVVGHPVVLLADKYWRELVRQCVARGTYRGAGQAKLRRRMRQQTTAVAGGGSTAWWQQQQRSPTAHIAAPPRAPRLRSNSSGVEDTAATIGHGGDGLKEGSGSRGDAAGVGAAVEDPQGQGQGLQEDDGLLDGGRQGGRDVENHVDVHDTDNGGEEYGEEYNINDWDDGSEADDEERDQANLADVVQQLAEMATLGMGCEDEIYPNLADLNSFHEQQSAYFEEMPFRVQL